MEIVPKVLRGCAEGGGGAKGGGGCGKLCRRCMEVVLKVVEVVVEVVPKVLRCCAKGGGGCSEGGFGSSRLFGQNALMGLHGHRAWE